MASPLYARREKEQGYKTNARGEFIYLQMMKDVCYTYKKINVNGDLNTLVP